MGEEGANVLFDTWVHPLMMGLEEHLLHMFRDDFEFHAEASPSHLGSAAPRAAAVEATADPAPVPAAPEPIVVPTPGGPATWTPDAESELKKIPFFVRSKARRNTEAYAGQRGLTRITVETLYDAKAHFSR
jgi:light-independent protochlorophyllide reductase subunit B